MNLSWRTFSFGTYSSFFQKKFWAPSFTSHTALTSKFSFSFLKLITSAVEVSELSTQTTLLQHTWSNSPSAVKAAPEPFHLQKFLGSGSPDEGSHCKMKWNAFFLNQWLHDSNAKSWHCSCFQALKMSLFVSVWCCWKERFGWWSSCWSDGYLQGSHVTCMVILVTSQLFGAVSKLLSWICCHKGHMVKMSSVPGKRFNLNLLHLQINSFSCCNDRCNKLSLP